MEYNGHWKTDGRRDYHDEQHLKIYARMIQSPRSLTTCSRGAGRPVARQKKCKLRPDLAAVVPGPGKEPGAQQNCLPRSELCRWIGYRGSHSVRRSRSAPDGYRGRMLIDLLIVGGERAQCAQSRPAASDWFCPASSGNVIFTRGKSGRGGGPSEAADTVQALRQRVH